MPKFSIKQIMTPPVQRGPKRVSSRVERYLAGGFTAGL